MREQLLAEMRQHHWVETAASWNNLGVKYHNNVPSDYEKAKFCYEQASLMNQNHAVANYNLGLLYENGYGVAQDIATAKNYYNKSASQNYENAIGRCLAIEMRENNWTTANDWVRLGVRYHNQKEYAKARICYQESLNLDSKNVCANHNFGIIYEYGYGLEPDIIKAEGYYKKAALNGYDPSIRACLIFEIRRNKREGKRNIFEAAYSNDCARLAELLNAHPYFLNIKAEESFFTACAQVRSWATIVAKKTLSSFLGLAAAGAIMVETGGIALFAGGSLSAMTVAAWECGDKSLKYNLFNRDGWTLLHFAAYGNASDAALLLIGRGADTEVQVNKQKCLHWAKTPFKDRCVRAREQYVTRLAAENDRRRQAIAQEAERQRMMQVVAEAQRNAEAVGQVAAAADEQVRQANARMEEERQRSEEIRRQAENMNRLFHPQPAVIPGVGRIYVRTDDAQQMVGGEVRPVVQIGEKVLFGFVRHNE